MTPPPSSAAAVEAQQARQDHLDERYHQDGRHERSHPMHGLYTGLVQHKPTTQEDPMDEFVVFSTRRERIVIRKSSIHAFSSPASSGETVVEYGGDSVIVRETFDEVCTMLGVAVPLQKQS